VVWQAKIGKCSCGFHALVTQVVDGKDAAGILQSKLSGGLDQPAHKALLMDTEGW